MEIKKGIVKNIQADGTWKSDYGLFYRWEITIGNDTGLYLSKDENQSRFVVGSEVSYQWDGAKNRIKYQNPDYDKPFQEKSTNSNQSNSNRDELIVKQNALTNAVQTYANGGCGVDEVLDTAEIYANWVLKGEKPSQSDKSNDLPF